MSTSIAYDTSMGMAPMRIGTSARIVPSTPSTLTIKTGRGDLEIELRLHDTDNSYKCTAGHEWSGYQCQITYKGFENVSNGTPMCVHCIVQFLESIAGRVVEL